MTGMRAQLFFSIVVDYNKDVMQRLQDLNNHLQSEKNRPSQITQLLWERRNRLLQALEPHLSDLTRYLLRKEYRKVLPKILQARGEFKHKFREVNRKASSPAQSSKVWQQFRSCLSEKLHEIISGLLSELSDRLAERITLSPSNPIARGLHLYSAVTGSYQHRLTLLQRLSPNIRTLSYIENEMVQHSGERELASSMWVLLYIFSFAFVQVFGKYITRAEKEEVVAIVRGEFVRNLAVVVGNLEPRDREEEHGAHLAQKVNQWIEEIAKNIHQTPKPPSISLSEYH